MNADQEKSIESYRALLLLEEIARGESLSQRELAGRLGIALGLVNSYLKNLVAKGFVRVRNFPRNRYGYLLTPQGLAEKSRLAYQHLAYFTSLYTTTRQDYLQMFRSLEDTGVRQVVFCGVDEVAEIAYLSLRETGLELEAVLDDERVGEVFFGRTIVPLAELQHRIGVPVIVTSLKRQQQFAGQLLRLGVANEAVWQPAAMNLGARAPKEM